MQVVKFQCLLGDKKSRFAAAAAYIFDENLQCDRCAGDIVNQAKDSGAKFIVTSQKCAAKSVDVKDQMPDQIKVVLLHRRLTPGNSHIGNVHLSFSWFSLTVVRHL